MDLIIYGSIVGGASLVSFTLGYFRGASTQNNDTTITPDLITDSFVPLAPSLHLEEINRGVKLRPTPKMERESNKFLSELEQSILKRRVEMREHED